MFDVGRPCNTEHFGPVQDDAAPDSQHRRSADNRKDHSLLDNPLIRHFGKRYGHDLG